MIVFFEINHNKLRTKQKKKKKKKKKRCQSFFCRIDLDPPPPPPDENSWIRACYIYSYIIQHLLTHVFWALKRALSSRRFF